jgi:hypothetical protein
MADLREKALRLASILPQGSDVRRSLLTVLKREAGREVGQTILDQMGGMRRLNNMLGLTDLAFLPNGVEFGWPNRQRSKGNFVRITLRPDDTYNVEFENISTRDRKPVKKYQMVYADQLGEIFEKQTGWYLRLGSKKIAYFERDLEEFYGSRKLRPTNKDYQRLWDMDTKANGDDRKLLAIARRMAQSITHPDKAYRRYAAAEDENFHDVARIFHDRAQDLWRAGER